MYFEDLSPYAYEVSSPKENVKMVGWLSSDFAYPAGEIDEEFLEKLKKLLVTNFANPMRGFHYCEFCKAGEFQISGMDKRFLLGMSEVWVPSPDKSIIYAAPAMVFHYIEAHKYLPPREFIAAVNDFDPACGWNAEEIAKQILYGI